MKFKHIATVLLLVFTSVSCMKDDSALNNDSAGSIITGHITDADGKPIEHIKVSLTWNKNQKEIVYTSSEGIYKASIEPEWSKNGQMSVSITIEDIDGEENGGHFSTLNDTILLLENNQSSDIPEVRKDYRLSPATL